VGEGYAGSVTVEAATDTSVYTQFWNF